MFEHLEEQKSNQEKQSDNHLGGESFLLRNTIEKLTASRVSVASPFKTTTNELENRIKKLEEKGRKRGLRFSLIGMIGGFLVMLAIIFFSRYVLKDLVNIGNKMDESTNAVIGAQRNLERPASAKADLPFVEDEYSDNEYQDDAEIIPLQAEPAVSAEAGEAAADNEGKNAADSILPQEQIDIPADAMAADSDGDRDQDGLSDSAELQYGTDPDNPDTDGDGYPDGEEINGGYDPLH